jgi:hypothetical protein
MFPISDRVLIVFGDPSQLWAALILMEIFLFKRKKKLFSRVKYDNMIRCPGETSDTYLTIDQKFIGVVRDMIF